MKTPPEELNLDRLSEKLRKSIVETLGAPIIPLFLDRRPAEPVPSYAGSGVLVEAYGVSGILTAEHVIFNPKMPFESGQALWTIPRFYSMDRVDDPIVDEASTHPSATNIQMDLLSWHPESPHRKNYETQAARWGPDLAFIRLPQDALTAFGRTLRAVRINFYSLAREPQARMQRALDETKTILAIVGAPAEWIEDDPSPRAGQMIERIKSGVLLTAQEQYQPAKNGYDFIDALIGAGPGTLIPGSFGGVSGGALWRFRDPFHTVQPMRELQSGDYVLAGIAFWEHLGKRKPFIRSHGPRSLYEKFLPELRDWLRKPGEIKKSFRVGLMRKQES